MLNSKMDSINFLGKKEVLYGLKKATKAASNVEKFRSYSCGPRPVNMSSEVAKSKGELSAYLDMTINDEAFSETLSEITKSKSHKIYEELHNNLKPIKVANTEFSPFTTFQDAFNKACNANLPLATNSVKNIFTKFFNNIATGIKK